MLCPLGAVLLLVLHKPELLGGSAFVDGEVSPSGPAASPVGFFVATALCRALVTTQKLLAIPPSPSAVPHACPSMFSILITSLLSRLTSIYLLSQVLGFQ